MTAALLILLASAFLSAVASTLYYALRDYSLTRLEELAESRGTAARKRIDPIIEDQDGHLLAMGAVRVVASIAVTVSMLLVLGAFRVGPIEVLNPPAAIVPGAAPGEAVLSFPRLAGAVVCSWVVLYLVGLVVPLSLARHAAERILLSTTGFIRVIYALAWPVRALWVIDEAVRRLAGAGQVSEKEEIREELLDAAAEGEREGAIVEEQRDMIEAVVEFGTTTAAEVMTPRTDIEAIQLTDDLGKVIKMVREVSHSRIPVYEGTADHIVGIFYVKDLMRWLAGDGVKGAGKPFRLRSILRPALFVPETKPVRELLKDLIKQKVHIAIVTDEYGGTAGVVTVEDIVEEVFGEIQDEYELPEDAPPEVKVDRAANTADADARMSIYDLNEALEPLGVTIPEGKDYDTVGGYVMATLGHIPIAGETVEGDGFAVTVLEAEPTRVLRLKIEPREAAHESDEREPEAQPTARSE
ncbi:MAG: hemolysin family protein [Phycisphaerales bacterium]